MNPAPVAQAGRRRAVTFHLNIAADAIANATACLYNLEYLNSQTRVEWLATSRRWATAARTNLALAETALQAAGNRRPARRAAR